MFIVYFMIDLVDASMFVMNDESSENHRISSSSNDFKINQSSIMIRYVRTVRTVRRGAMER